MKGKNIPTQTWQAVRTAYLLGQGSCSELAARFGLTTSAVTSRCVRERWRRSLADTAARLERKVDEEITRRAKTLAERAQEFTERSASDVERFLDLIGVERDRLPPGDIESLARLITAWRTPVELGRKTYGLDADEPPLKRQLAVISVGEVRYVGPIPTTSGITGPDSSAGGEDSA